ncbi:gamma-butyrobetaine hydroxylase-like domain-containing protein [Tunturiibacter gelidiferens]|uniref:gamma-butyrobetaine hydroxylase-like domain-containing protein n=1 Tax=Tunturiibacter gelidiferens TaxID=3069689 RepID=UPI003D9B2C21
MELCVVAERMSVRHLPRRSRKDRQVTGEAKAKDQSLLKMYEAPVRPLEVTPVGKYALKFKWSDGHESGIYSWDYLRRVCRCDGCMTKQAS